MDIFFKPIAPDCPPRLWRARARAFVVGAHKSLLTNKGALEYLRRRGVTGRAIRRFKVGFNPRDRYEDRATWGLPVDSDRERVWLPGGWVIPAWREGGIMRVRIRRRAGEPKYVVVSGSVASMPLVLLPESLENYVSFECYQYPLIIVTESELDALALWGLRPEFLTVGLGSVHVRPDADLHQLLTNVERILVVPDFDVTGFKMSRWWVRTYPQITLWPTPSTKDVGEMFQAGHDVRAWLDAGIARTGWTERTD